MSILELYRGDSSKIKEFEFNKTSKHCLFGQGVYLSDSKRVADSYRDKGIDTNDHEVQLAKTIVPGMARIHKEPLLKAGFDTFVEIHWNQRFNYPLKKSSIEYKKLVDELSDVWYFGLEDNTISITKTLIGVTHTHTVVRVVWKRFTVGYLSTFHFDEQFLLNNVVNLDACLFDDSFLGLVYDNQLQIFTPYDTRENFIKHNRTGRVQRASNKDWNRLRVVLEPYGIIGFQYNGGLRIGGHGRHRAFVIWDDDYVNRHKVSRVR